MLDRRAYDDILQQVSLPLFFQSWWLDAVAGVGRWSAVATYDGEGRPTGVWPFLRRQRWGISYLTTPVLCPGLGPWLCYPPEPQKLVSRHDFEWRVLTDLLEALPPASHIVTKPHYRFTNWLPLEQRGWKQRTRYSYVWPATQDAATVWAGMGGRNRTNIRKAGKLLTVTESSDIGLLYRLLVASFVHRQDPLPVDQAFLERIHHALQTHRCGQFLVAQDAQGHPHAAIYVAWDHTSTYNLLQGSDPAYRSSGAVSLLLWQVMQDSVARGTRFDFEGSHLPGVEPFFRSFGGEMWAYHHLSYTVPWLRPLLTLRRMV